MGTWYRPMYSLFSLYNPRAQSSELFQEGKGPEKGTMKLPLEPETLSPKP